MSDSREAMRAAVEARQEPKALNGIPATQFHGEGAIARCSYCGRYSLDRKTLGEDRYQPVCECGEKHGWSGSFKRPGADAKWSGRAPEVLAASPAAATQGDARKLWLWKNFVGGRPEYWAFDNPFPINLADGDPQTLGEPCGYALFKPSRQGRTDVSEEQVIARIHAAIGAESEQATEDRKC